MTLIRTRIAPVLAAGMVSLGLGGQPLYGQQESDEPGADAPRGRIVIQTSSGPIVRDPEVRPFERAEAMVWLASQGIRSNGRIPDRLVPQDPAAPYLEADRLRLDRAANVVVAEGNVVLITTTDGSTVSVRADRMTIEQRP